jgi:hypothetical protein
VRIALEIFLKETRSVEQLISLNPTDCEEFSKSLDIDLQFLSRGARYEISGEELAQLSMQFTLNICAEKHYGFIRAFNKLDELPYKVHTNRELKLMLQGVKPLAVFSDGYPAEANSWVIPEDVFEPHVKSGNIVSREFIYIPKHTLPSPLKGCRYMLYARIGEEWRMEAYIVMIQASQLSGWNEGFERMEGALLGYAEWQTDAFLKMKKESQMPLAMPGNS